MAAGDNSAAQKFVQGCKFKVTLDNLGTQYAMSVSNQSIETPTTPLNVGFSSQGQPGIPIQAPLPALQQDATKITVQFATLQGDIKVRQWYDQCTTGQLAANKQEMMWIEYTTDNQPGHSSHLSGAFPTSYRKEDLGLDATSKVQIETVEIIGTNYEVQAA
ncbi:phage tail protein [Calothrix sp. FACHB-156]|uniref:phage tail protein n=1 Tax=Calothrix sp. NIES-2100 TaxID=1954172 RepID=UPI000B61D92F|nr:phage tail protein [Nostoc linckia FACHB-104]MBD2340760.1 phage tail protein [Calothrix sp. FACHB-156]BAY28092.1 hypothetical protein NIES2100_79210 [Calothrix sp. NIES-2100]